MHLTSAILLCIKMVNNELILLCTFFPHLFSLTYYSFFLPFCIQVRNPLFIHLYIHIIHLLFSFTLSKYEKALLSIEWFHIVILIH